MSEVDIFQITTPPRQQIKSSRLKFIIKGIGSPDWKGLQMVSLDRFEV
jgi:hypothetical protein